MDCNYITNDYIEKVRYFLYRNNFIFIIDKSPYLIIIYKEGFYIIEKNS